MTDICPECGLREGENHDLPGRCTPDPIRLAIRAERVRIADYIEKRLQLRQLARDIRDGL
jgi:hypothetical protein